MWVVGVTRLFLWVLPTVHAMVVRVCSGSGLVLPGPRGAVPASGTGPCASQGALSLSPALGVVGPRVFRAAEPPTFRLPCVSPVFIRVLSAPPSPRLPLGFGLRHIAVGFGQGCASVTDGISSGPAVLTPDLCVTSAAERGSGCPRPLRDRVRFWKETGWGWDLDLGRSPQAAGLLGSPGVSLVAAGSPSVGSGVHASL